MIKSFLQAQPWDFWTCGKPEVHCPRGVSRLFEFFPLVFPFSLYNLCFCFQKYALSLSLSLSIYIHQGVECIKNRLAIQLSYLAANYIAHVEYEEGSGKVRGLFKKQLLLGPKTASYLSPLRLLI